MKKNYSAFKSISFVWFVGISLFIATACENDITDGLDSRITKSNDPPMIESVSPEGKALSGVSEITIVGSNFSSVIEENLVTFGNGNVAKILEASPTRLLIKAPLVSIPADSDGIRVDIRVAVVGSELPSTMFKYELLETLKELYVDQLAPNQYYGLCVDKNKNIYSSAYSLKPRVYKGEYLLPFKGEPVLYNKKDFTHFSSLKFGPDGIILGARADKVQALFQIVPNAKPEVYVILPNNTQVIDFDVDDQKNIWVGGVGGKIFSISYPSKQIKEFVFTGSVNAVRVYKDGSQTYLFTSVVRGGVEKIYRSAINVDGSLGTEEVYFDLSTIYNSGVATRAITFSEDGVLFVGNNGINPVITIDKNKSVKNLYPELLKADLFNSQKLDELISFSWGPDDDLYIVRKREQEFKQSQESFQNIVRVLTQRRGAPYYGRDL